MIIRTIINWIFGRLERAGYNSLYFPEICATRFRLQDATGADRGFFGLGADGEARLRLLGPNGPTRLAESNEPNGR